MHAHLRKRKIEDLISEHTTGFLDRTLTVEVTVGDIFKPMRLSTNYFVPTDKDFLQQLSLPSAAGHRSSQFVRLPSAPIGILELSISEMKIKCNDYIENMISSPW